MQVAERADRRRLGLALLLALGLASPAAAGITVDLVWQDTGSDSLTVEAGDTGNDACVGPAGVVTAIGRCLRIVWTVDDPNSLSAGSTSVAWDTASGLSASYAAFMNSYREIPMGKFATLKPGPLPTIRNDLGELQSFAAASNPPAEPLGYPSSLAPGTYVLGTIVWDVSSAVIGLHSLDSFLLAGTDGFLDIIGSPNTDVELRGATLLVTPEPGSAGLLAAALAMLALARRRSR